VQDLLPLNVQFISERFGLFQIIVIGETVIAGAGGFSDFFNVDIDRRYNSVMSLLLSVLTKLLYYELQGEQKRHAIRVSVKRSMIFFMVHAFIYTSLVGMGSLLHVVTAGVDWDSEQKLLFLILAGVYLLSISVMALTHEGVGKGLRRVRKEVRVSMRITLGILLIVIGVIIFNSDGGITDTTIVSVVSFGFLLDFLFEFEGIKFSNQKCGREGSELINIQELAAE